MSGGSQPTMMACIRAWQALRRAYELVSTQIEAALQQCCDLTPSELQAMVIIQEAGDQGVRLTAITDQVSLSQPAVSRLVERLEDRGLIIRQVDASDRRGIRLDLTADGYELLHKASEIHAATIHTALGSILNQEDQERLLEVFQQLDSSSR